jgi:hypothetical protein
VVFVVIHDYELFCTCLEVLGTVPNVRVICEPHRARAATRIRAERPALVVVDTDDDELERAAAAISVPLVRVTADHEDCRAGLADAVRSVAAWSPARSNAARPL